jgi:hypothetical protein
MAGAYNPMSAFGHRVGQPISQQRSDLQVILFYHHHVTVAVHVASPIRPLA